MESHETPPVGEDELRSARATRKKERRRTVPLLPEVRHLSTQNLEVRDIGGNGDTVQIVGTPVVYNSPYVVADLLGEFEERMAPGVATDVLPTADVRFLIDHDPSRLLARTTSGTLKLSDGDAGLQMAATIDLRDSDARNLMVRLERGDVSQMSCGFIVAQDEWSEDWDQRTIYRFADLLDVSAVTYPASPTTDIGIAKRMALQMPVESRARLRKAYVDLRAGKALAPERLEAFRALLDPGADLETPAGTGRLGSPDGNGDTWADEGDLELPDATPADGTEGNDATGSNAGAPPQDGTGSRSAPATAVERREQSMSFDDKQTAVYQALCARYGGFGPGADLWICAIGEDWVVWEAFCAPSGQFRLTYTMDDSGNVTLADGPPEPVERVTSYEPKASERASRLTRIRVQRALRGL